MQYSCAYWKGLSVDDPDGLNKAQIQKMRLIAEKLQLKPGMTVVDIGCGWGTLDCFLAQEYKVHVRGINISTEQIKFAQNLAKERGVSQLTNFVLEDYRKLRGQFDR
jgi:cyclopropane-fatty-acyl-phospholipid synthase